MILGSLGSVDQVAQAIQTQENYTQNYAALNNPGMLIAAGQPGCTPSTGGFCAFPTYDQGYQALVNQIELDASRGYTILQFTTKYLGGDPANPGVAPGGDPNVYAANIAAATGLTANDLLSAALDAGGIDAVLASASSNMPLLLAGAALLLALALY